MSTENPDQTVIVTAEQRGAIRRILGGFPYSGDTTVQLKSVVTEVYDHEHRRMTHELNFAALIDVLTNLSDAIRKGVETAQAERRELDELHRQRSAIRQFLGTEHEGKS